MTRQWMLACVVLLAAAGSRTGRAQPARPTLFTSPPVITQATRGVGADEPSAPNARLVRVDADRLRDRELVLNLFAGVTIEAHSDSAGPEVGGSWVWHGTANGEPLSSVTLVQAGAIVQGSIRSAAGSFSIEPIGDGPDHMLRRLEASMVLPELVPRVPPVRPFADAAPEPQFDDGSVIDVLVVYTAAARAQASGSDAAVTARIALGVAETNAAYANSGVVQRLRLVGTELVGYQEGADLSRVLEHVTAEGDGHMDGVHARRLAVGADLVALVVGSTASGSCGVAWVMQFVSPEFAPYAFSVTAYPCISPNYTFGHELGHNMGSAHAPADPNAEPAFAYSYGYKDPAATFRTIMAYDCPGGCPRVLHFSNPSVAYATRPTGTISQHNNALSMNQTALTVANFRQSRVEGTLLSEPHDLTLDATETTVTLAWRAPDTGVASHYLIEVGNEEGFSNVAALVVGGNTTSLVYPGVPPGNYAVRVRAVDAFGPGPPSDSVLLIMTSDGRCIDQASAPTLQSPIVNGSSATLAWTAPVTGAPIRRYLVGVGRHPQTVNVAILDTGVDVGSFTTQAEPGVYFVRVAAVNPCGIGIPSNELSLVVGPPVPGPAINLAAALSTNQVVHLSWQWSGAGGSPTGYVVEAGSSPGESNIAVLPTGSAQPSFSVVAPPGRYYVRVRAVNDAGASVASGEVAIDVL